MKTYEIHEETLLISDDPARLNRELIHHFLSEHSYWARGVSPKMVNRSLDHSLCFGVYQAGQQVGFARVVTDFATFAWLADVFVVEDKRGQGIGKKLVAAVLATSPVAGPAAVHARDQGCGSGFMPGSVSSRWRNPNVLWKSVRKAVTTVAVEMAAESKMKTKKVAIIGASGYSGEELVRLLLHHPHAELAAVTSRQNAGQTLAQVFPKFASHPKSKTLRFTEPKAELLAKQAEVVFLALPHGVAAEYAVPLLDAGCAVIDLKCRFPA